MKRGVATPYGITKRASRKNDWKFSPAAFFGREGLREVYSAEQVYLGKLGVVKIVLLRDDQPVRDLVRCSSKGSKMSMYEARRRKRFGD
jgi:hypothetical protein